MSSYGIYLSGLGALGQSVRVDQISNNLANSSTPGFRRDSISFRERLVEALEDRHDLKFYNAMVHRHGGAPFIDRVGFDRTGGGFEATGRPLDFALDGSGFFTVRDPETGAAYYTRAGNFTVNGSGTLVTADGRHTVVGEDGRDLTVDPEAGAIQLRDGTLFQGDVEIGRLGVVEFEDYSRVAKRGENLFENRGSGFAAPSDARVEQGTLERSSVNPLVEMTEMIKALRALESNLQMIRFQDATLERSVNDFGRPQR